MTQAGAAGVTICAARGVRGHGVAGDRRATVADRCGKSNRRLRVAAHATQSGGCTGYRYRNYGRGRARGAAGADTVGGGDGEGVSRAVGQAGHRDR